jgi:hypothetical protein
MPSETLRYPCRAPRRLRDLSKIAMCPMVELRHPLKIIKYKYHQKLHREMVLAPPAGSSPLPRRPRGPLSVPYRPGTPVHKTKKIILKAPDPFPVPEGSGSATCPEAHSKPPARRGLGVAMCPIAQSTPPTRKGLQCRHVPQGTMCTTR